MSCGSLSRKAESPSHRCPFVGSPMVVVGLVDCFALRGGSLAANRSADETVERMLALTPGPSR
jgi:hypothetical protein